MRDGSRARLQHPKPPVVLSSVAHRWEQPGIPQSSLLGRDLRRPQVLQGGARCSKPIAKREATEGRVLARRLVQRVPGMVAADERHGVAGPAPAGQQVEAAVWGQSERLADVRADDHVLAGQDDAVGDRAALDPGVGGNQLGPVGPLVVDVQADIRRGEALRAPQQLPPAGDDLPGRSEVEEVAAGQRVHPTRDARNGLVKAPQQGIVPAGAARTDRRDVGVQRALVAQRAADFAIEVEPQANDGVSHRPTPR